MKISARIKKVDTSALRRRFLQMIRRSEDFRPLFRWAFQELEMAHRRNFFTEGGEVGGWSRLDPQYASWKLAHYGERGILVRTGDLKDSLTVQNARGAVREAGPTKATFGTSIDYASYHQTGTRFMPRREVVFVPRTFQLRAARAAGEHIMYGTEIGETYQELRAGRF